MKIHIWDIMAVLGIFTLSCWIIVLAYFLKITISDLKTRGDHEEKQLGCE
ncbi:MAG: hypothetical protein RLZZ408_928 [Verrucomicrobiota bacterium]|jgi:hypothetical protein